VSQLESNLNCPTRINKSEASWGKGRREISGNSLIEKVLRENQAADASLANVKKKNESTGTEGRKNAERSSKMAHVVNAIWEETKETLGDLA